MKYLQITCPDLNNGVGCRATLWLPGCSHKCKGCHNAWTANYNQGKEFDKEAYNKLINILKREEITGLTISGGDPLDQSDEVLSELSALLANIFVDTFPKRLNIWIYSGYYKEDLTRESQKNVLEFCDVLVDGPYEEDKRDITLPFRGSSNQRIWNLNLNEIIPDGKFRI